MKLKALENTDGRGPKPKIKVHAKKMGRRVIGIAKTKIDFK